MVLRKAPSLPFGEVMIEDQKIGRLLINEGIITEDQLEKALEAQEQSYGKKLGEVMMEIRIIQEADFLRVLAKQFHTQYLTSKKLAEIKVPDTVLKLVPVATAEKHNLFPVQYKKSDKTLTIIMKNPTDMAAIDEVKFVSGIGNLKALVGFEEAIKAAIDKWYKNDPNAFSMLLDEDTPGYELASSSSSASDGMVEADSSLDLSALVSGGGKSADEGEPEIMDEDDYRVDIGAEEDDGVYLGGMEEMPGDNNISREGESGLIIEDVVGDDSGDVEEVMVAPVTVESPDESPKEEQKQIKRPDVKRYRLRMLVVESHDSIRKFITKLFAHEGFKVRGVSSREEALKEMERSEYDSLVIKEKDLGEGDDFTNTVFERFPDVELCSIKDYGSALIGETRAQKRLMSSFLETLDVILGLLEMESGHLQGHTHNTAKYTKLIAAKFELAQREVDSVALAAYVHELGRKGSPHRSLINAGDVDAEELLEGAEVPLKLLASAKFPLEITPIIRHQFERWDGKGVPDGLKGEEIPVGARIMSLVEAFEHLTSKYTEGGNMEPTAALEEIKKHSEEFFQPELVDILLGVVKDDIYLQQMSSAQERILVVDTEADQLTLLELRLGSMGFAVSSAYNGEHGIEKAKETQPSLIITEANLPDMTGFEMIEKIKADPDIGDTPFLFISKRDDSASINKGFQLGAEDYIIKPIRVEILGAKINTMMGRLKAEKKTAPAAAAGVSGSLSEMGIPDIVQILGAGRKTGRITLQDNGKSCYVDMEDGQVVNASVDDLKGEEAFYQILYWTDGTFSIDPNAEISERLINMSNDSLMLEGYRRMDEGGKETEEDITLDGSDFF